MLGGEASEEEDAETAGARSTGSRRPSGRKLVIRTSRLVTVSSKKALVSEDVQRLLNIESTIRAPIDEGEDVVGRIHIGEMTKLKTSNIDDADIDGLKEGRGLRAENADFFERD